MDKNKVPDINELDNSDKFMLFLSLQGINNICYQPFGSNQDNNEIIFKSLLGIYLIILKFITHNPLYLLFTQKFNLYITLTDSAKSVDVLLFKLYIKNQLSRLTFRIYGIPNIINTKNTES